MLFGIMLKPRGASASRFFLRWPQARNEIPPCYGAGRSGQGSAMNETDRERADEQILTFEMSDAALEAAAEAVPGAAMSFPNAPTVSILFACCSND